MMKMNWTVGTCNKMYLVELAAAVISTMERVREREKK